MNVPAAIIAALVSAAVASVTALLVQRRSHAFAEAQERWKFKADVYSKALSSMRRMRQPFEVAAHRGEFPKGPDLQRALDASLELSDAATRAALWLPEPVIRR